MGTGASSIADEVETIKTMLTTMVKENNEVKKEEASVQQMFDKYYLPDCSIIRPSGNPMGLPMYKGMLLSDDILMESDELLSIGDVKVFAGGSAAVAVYTTRTKFSYKGTPNDDVAVFSATLEKTSDGWKIVHAHRATGQKPE